MKTTDCLFKTVRIKKPIFEDGYLDKGMIGRIEAIRDKESDMWEIIFNLKDFREHNLKHEERNYWDRETGLATKSDDLPCVTWDKWNSTRPTKRNKYVMFNCWKWKVIWEN